MSEGLELHSKEMEESTANIKQGGQEEKSQRKNKWNCNPGSRYKRGISTPQAD
jgi:hypothetical protein